MNSPFFRRNLPPMLLLVAAGPFDRIPAQKAKVRLWRGTLPDQASAPALKHDRGESKPSHTNFHRLSFFLLYGKQAKAGGRSNGLEYFPKAAPEHYSYLDPRMGRSIVVYSAENYVSLSEFWALKAIVHELAHAHQLEQWPEDQPDILQAYQHATSEELYRHVRDLDGKVLDEGYAATNQLEYFAELSCVYFVGGHYYPFNREQLKTYDLAGFSLVRKLWRLDELGKEERGL
jgi:hypothetical protein